PSGLLHLVGSAAMTWGHGRLLVSRRSVASIAVTSRLTCPPIGEQRLGPLDAVRVVLPTGDLERALGLGVRLVLRAPRPERPREVEARAEVVRVDFQRAAELPLGVLRVAAEQARRVEEQRALSGERISEVRRQLEGAIDLAPQPAKLGKRADAGPRAPHLTAEAAEDREVGER